MPKLKQPPATFESYVPDAPARAIIVSLSTMAFCAAVYRLGIDPSSVWRAVSVEQARAMQVAWLAKGIKSYVVPLPNDLQALEADEPTPSRHGRTQQSYQSFEGVESDAAITEGAEASALTRVD